MHECNALLSRHEATTTNTMYKIFQHIQSIINYRFYRAQLLQSSQLMELTQRTAMIFAPHQDDESLGCGGTIVLKRAAGVPIKIVYLTGGQNGQLSHPGRDPIPSETLTALRNQEALQALEVLGVSPQDVAFLNYQDGGLRKTNATTRAEIVAKIVQLLADFHPEEVYVTYRSDGHPDHNATYLLVFEAMRQRGLALDLLEYPVWSIHNPRLNFSAPEFKNFYRLAIGSVRKQKKQAILCFRSQYVPIGGLTHIFLRRLSSPYEFFIKSCPVMEGEMDSIPSLKQHPIDLPEQPVLAFLKNLIKRALPEPLAWRYLSKLSPRLAETLSGFAALPERQFLKSTIFSYLIQKAEFQRILFVGCDWYTKTYETILKGKEYWTIEVDPRHKAYGAAKHIIAPLNELSKYFQPDYFDAIICNDMFQKGAMDTHEQAEPAFDQCFTRLRQGGVFVLGWNDSPGIYPYPLTESQSLKQFEAYRFPPIAASTYLSEIPYRHTYTFFSKPCE